MLAWSCLTGVVLSLRQEARSARPMPGAGAPLRIVQELIGQKLAGRELLAREKLGNSSVAQTIAEARLALAALESDPGLGLLHMDSRTPDSLACGLMAPIRPQVDAYVLE